MSFYKSIPATIIFILVLLLSACDSKPATENLSESMSDTADTVNLLIEQTVVVADDTANTEQELIDIIHAIEKGWETADGTPFRNNYLDFEGARYIESGGQNEGLTDLVEHHVEPEGDSLDGLDLVFTNIETHIEGDFAWALADVEVIALIKRDNRQLHNRGHETFLFKRIDNQWKVVHTHSSSRPVKKD